VTADNKRLARRWYEEVLNGQDFALVNDLVAPDFVINGETVGPEGIKAAAVWVRSVFPDLRVTVEDVVAEGDRVVTRFSARATHRGEFLGVPPTGKPVVLTGVHVDRVAGGRIAERWESVDLLAVLTQLGVSIAPEVG
jgi:steroid delta-isomerase-like uncharacterized protein